MSNAVPSRLGQIDAAGATDALFLKVFAGEVLTAFGRESAFRQRHQVRVIPSGKSAQFPVTGRAAARYHTPGEEILGGVLKHGEKIITIDDMLISPLFIADVDEAKNHYEVRGIYSNEMGQILAKVYDQNVGRVGVLNARAAAALAELPSGAHDNNASYDTDGTVIWKGVFNAGVTLDLQDVPAQDRAAFMDAVRYALIVQSEKPINRDLNPNVDNGSIAYGNVERVNNIVLVKTNNLPAADDRANLDIPSARRADFSPTRVLVEHRSATGTVQLQDVSMQSQYDIRRQGTLFVGRYLVGHGGLRPEAGVELRTADPAA